ncbi:Fc.00g085670.m01.CDS01 [Cosmosporella sp. VM-42]
MSVRPDDAGDSLISSNRAAATAELLREAFDTIMAASSYSAPQAKHAFDRRVEDFKSPKNEINALILDYLTMEGYPNAANRFSKEANIQPQQDNDLVRARQEIQTSIHSGNIETAIETLNELDPQILEHDQALHFALLRLHLVELIRPCDGINADIAPALKFATEQLGPRAPTNKKFLEDLEKTMALLLFPRETLEPPLAALLSPDLRREVADEVNRAILRKQSLRRETAIRRLVQLRAWAENTAREKGKAIPDRLDIGLNGDESDSRPFDTSNGHEPMITT